MDSLVAFTEAGDRLTAEPADTLSLSLDGSFAAALEGEDVRSNLVWRAAETLAARLGRSPAVRLTLAKELPVAAGIGGGSSDAAAALLLLGRLWADPAMPAERLRAMLVEIATGLGADVPMCLEGRPVLARGIGELLSPVPALAEAGVLLVNPRVPLPTPAVFRARSGPFSDPGTLEAEAAASPGALARPESLARALSAQRNDLEAAAVGLVPAIGEVLRQLARSPGCLLARMSGSGATCFGLYPDEAAAKHAAAEIAAAEPGWWCRPTRLAVRDASGC